MAAVGGVTASGAVRVDESRVGSSLAVLVDSLFVAVLLSKLTGKETDEDQFPWSSTKAEGTNLAYVSMITAIASWFRR